MSVIAKLQLNGTLDFGTGSLSKLSCVCENDLMAAYAKSNEDRLFTKYSPWGEMRIGYGFKDKFGLRKFAEGHKFYAIALRSSKKPPCPGAEHVHPARCHVIHDFGTTKQIEVSYDGWSQSAQNPKPDTHPGEFHWRMSIDNPPAVAFFEPGKSDYWIAFYDAELWSIETALGDAHTFPEEDDAK